jgi:sigma-B regulation protein RsbU (phosphoserine phosphatase)
MWVHRHGFAVALALLGALVVIDVLTGDRVILISSFSASALVAAMLTTVRRTAVVAAIAIAAALAATAWDGLGIGSDWLTRFGICTGLSVGAVFIAGAREERERRLQRMTVIAEAAQRAVLRAMPTAVGAVGFAARYVSASREALVGGDLYEVAATPYGVRVIVGDVRGKGLDAVQLAASVLGAFRQTAFTTERLADVARGLDDVVSKLSGDEDFVTAILGEFHEDGDVLLVNCGHHPPLLARREAPGELVDTGDPALPLGLGTEPEESRHSWPVGSRLLFYTDGLVEARDDRGVFFPLDGYAEAVATAGLEDALDDLVAELLAHTKRQLNDDMALVLAERLSPEVGD